MEENVTGTKTGANMGSLKPRLGARERGLMGVGPWKRSLELHRQRAEPTSESLVEAE